MCVCMICTVQYHHIVVVFSQPWCQPKYIGPTNFSRAYSTRVLYSRTSLISHPDPCTVDAWRKITFAAFFTAAYSSPLRAQRQIQTCSLCSCRHPPSACALICLF